MAPGNRLFGPGAPEGKVRVDFQRRISLLALFPEGFLATRVHRERQARKEEGGHCFSNKVFHPSSENKGELPICSVFESNPV
ncbi:MAG: hypothetical protein D6679_04805 [Candidatus Hydrogenedentota bacterium]|nr:MAG: hypothetical protein D6679_04805 [Candidatus Hydrogenedentota bacterium]